MFRKAYTFDDVALVPKYNNVSSRTEPDLSTWLTSKTQVKMPLVPSNMDTVIGKELAEIIIANGSFPIFHRFMSFEDKRSLLLNYGPCSYISSGVKKEDLHDIFKLFYEFNDFKFKGVCFDIAHGHSKVMMDGIKAFKDKFPNSEVIAGNVCTARAYHDLANAGADAIKVGIGPGAACTTRMVTGFGVPQFTAICDCAEVAQELRVPLIADGGIRNSRDIVLALAAGASSVMIGKLFALTEESAAEKRTVPDNRFIPGCDIMLLNREAKYRGQASKEFQDDVYGGLKVGTVPEGQSFWGPVSGTAQQLIDNLVGGIRSGLTYGSARSIKELQRKAEFVEVTSTYQSESSVRKE